MQKEKLNRFIQKYNLGGDVNSVKWTSKDNKLTTSFVSSDKSLLGKVIVDKFPFEESEIGVYSTDQLKSLINVLGDDIDLGLEKHGDRPLKIKIKNNNSVSVEYVLSDLSVIPDTRPLKRLPDFQTSIKLDKTFIDSFIKGKGALPEADSFTILNNKDGKLEVVIGYSSTNTHRVTIPVKTDKNGLTKSISFNAKLFKDVLVANKECTSAVLDVSNEGLAKVNFKVDDYDSEYYIVALQGV
tara:strand:- start:2470 stop:3192 length:723 start_codon:yes stop_codon:yes gene_type:complete